jgi:gas vesicle protein
MDRNHPNDKKGGHFFNGFFWGAAIGGGLAYLLSTKKGREFLKELIQDGIDMLDDATTPGEELTFEPEVYEEISEEGIAEPSKTKPLDSDSVSSSPKKRFFKKVARK